MACTESFQLGVGAGSAAPQCGAFAHGCSVLGRWDQRVGSWRGGQHGGRSQSPCLVLRLQNPGWSGLKSAQFPPSLSLLLAALKTPVASLLPDVASR